MCRHKMVDTEPPTLILPHSVSLQCQMCPFRTNTICVIAISTRGSYSVLQLERGGTPP